MMDIEYFGFSKCWGGKVSRGKYRVGDIVRFLHAGASIEAEIIGCPGANTFGVVEYKVKWGDKVRWVYEHEITIRKYSSTKGCECGAAKVYGNRCTYADHAIWYPIRIRS